ncbi:hypothetical protein HHK36_030812 [Tetracentron sinense]|uniref:Uncharacterized protein n=1 Tax=Tetracentron sinense TaxID=13715 RepID=A0A834YBR4_TETSI|nr:hypothetical protein HHK36_030812 [Tetracentron sinense]
MKKESGSVLSQSQEKKKKLPYDKKPVSTNRQLQPKAGLNKLAASSGHKLTSADHRKQLGSNAGNGPGRPVGSKGLPSKLPAATTYKKASTVVAKNSMPGVHKRPVLKFQPSLLEQPLEQKKRFQDPNKAKVMPKQIVSSKKPQIKPLKHILSLTTIHERRPNILMKMTVMRMGGLSGKFKTYNPDKFSGADDDVSDMEANFEDIQKEERKSGKIAREEDERELRFIEEEEERRERLRKEVKKCKLGQR